MDNGVGLADIAEKLVAEPLTFEAPFTKPAMSTISTVVGMILLVFTSAANAERRSSGTVMTPTLGSMVQKGKLALCALALLRQLKSVDLPTLGRPTMPHCKLMYDVLLIWSKDTTIFRDAPPYLLR